MPCIDGREAEDSMYSYRASVILCAVIRKHGKALLQDLDYKQMGITAQQVDDWVKQHERADAYSRQRI